MKHNLLYFHNLKKNSPSITAVISPITAGFVDNELEKKTQFDEEKPEVVRGLNGVFNLCNNQKKSRVR